MSEVCSFGSHLKSECHKLDYVRTKVIERLFDMEQTTAEVLLWRAELRDCGEDVSTIICFHHKHYYMEMCLNVNLNRRKLCWIIGT